MQWSSDYIYVPQYKWTSTNQYGDRFKRKASKKLSVATLSCRTDDASGLTNLVLLSHTLNAPIHYDFKSHTAFIKVISYEAFQKGD